MRATFALFALIAFATSLHAAERPNILLILADDVGCDVLRSYGGTSYRTPHLDKLAKEGMRFNHCYSMPVCHPTRICLLTGRYPFRTGNAKWGSFPKAEERNTIAQSMKSAGYATVVAGKWQVALLGKDLQHPHRLGFDEYALFGWHEGARYHDPLIWQNGKRRPDTEGKYGPNIYTDVLIDFMTRERKQPFFAFYSMALCHDVTDDLKEPVPYGPDGRYLNYKEMAESMDEQVGKLVAALDRQGLRKNTLILFTGDNGTAKSSILRAENGKYIRVPVYSMQHGKRVRGGKGNLTNDGTNVPLIANWPGHVKAGTVSDALVDMCDFFPTSVDLAGGEIPSGVTLDGKSFSRALTDSEFTGRPWVYASRGGAFTVRDQEWKLYSNGRLFNMRDDPSERKRLQGRLSEDAESAKMKLTRAVDSLGRSVRGN